MAGLFGPLAIPDTPMAHAAVRQSRPRHGVVVLRLVWLVGRVQLVELLENPVNKRAARIPPVSATVSETRLGEAEPLLGCSPSLGPFKEPLVGPKPRLDVTRPTTGTDDSKKD
jgi:hypothetical protein